MQGRRLRIIAVGVLSAGAAACATTGGGAALQSATLPGTIALAGTPTCIVAGTVVDWTVLDDSTLIVHDATPTDAYLIKLRTPVRNLQFQDMLALQGATAQTGHTAQVCSSGSTLTYGENSPAQRAPISAVRRLTAPEVQKLVAALGDAAQRG